jgi:acetylornithine deacetylase/succinyl-diaminopimelate desuccinylase-like protein
MLARTTAAIVGSLCTKKMLRSEVERSIAAYLDEHDAEAVQLLRELVRIRSLARQEGTVDQPGTLVARLRPELGRGGVAEVDVQPLGASSQNLVEVLRGPGPRCFVIDAHTDTVPEGQPDRWFDGDPFSAAEGVVHYLGDRRIRIEVGSHTYEATIRDRMARVWETKRTARSVPIVYGRGTFDNKAAVASTVMAMRALAAVGVRLAGTVVAAYVADEEESASGVEAVCVGPESWLGRQGFLNGPRDPHGFLMDVSGVALDGSYGYTPVVGHRGRVMLEVNVQGRAAHASTPFLGVSAVVQMSRLLTALDDGQAALVSQLLPLMDAELLGPPSLAIGTTIVGGGVRAVVRDGEHLAVDRAGTNAVADWCEATIDLRYPPGRDYPADRDTFPEVIRAEVERFLRARVPESNGWSFSVRPPVGHASYPCALGRSAAEAADHPLVASARRVGEQVLGYVPDVETAPGGTDATVMIHHGHIPTLVELGAAGALSHDYHEFVERPMITAGAKVLALMAIDVLGLSS